MTQSPINFLTATINDLQELLRKGEVTSVQLVQAYLDRIQENNEIGLQLRAVQDEPARVPTLLRIAQGLDDLRAQGKVFSELHGIPLLVKDNIATVPQLGMASTAGSFALLNSIPSSDATVVNKLRLAGAIILGKTTMTELGGLKSSVQKMGQSARGGQGQSAYVAGGDPMGTSSGSAIAVSAGWAPASLATDTVGSSTAPAGRAALYALRPTMGLVSTFGMVPGAKSMDTIGPMAKTAYDVALLLQHMAGTDVKDTATVEADSHKAAYSVYTLPQHATFEGKRLGVPRATVFDSDMPWGNDVKRDVKVRSELDAAILKMQDLGATICDPADIPSSNQWKERRMSDEITMTMHEFKEDMKEYLATMKRTGVANVRDAIEFIEQHPDLEMPDGALSHDFLKAVDSTDGRDTQTYLAAAANFRRIGCKDGIDKVMSEMQLDALILPINALASSYAAAGGYPVAVLPLGAQANGEPFGFCLLGRKWSEPTLLSLMAAYEASFPARAVPMLLS